MAELTAPRPEPGKKARATDHLVRILEYRDGEHSILGSNHFGELAEYRIEPAAFERHEAKARARDMGPERQPPFFGHSIDAFMASALPPGRKIVMERAAFVSERPDGPALYEASRVLNPSTQDEDKLVVGLFTALRARGESRLEAVQRWSLKSISAFDAQGMEAIAARLEADRRTEPEAGYSPRQGFQLRLLRPGEGGGWTCIDSSFPVDYELARQAPGTPPAIARLGRRRFERLAAQYIEEAGALFPHWRDEGCVVDVATHVEYLASSSSAHMSTKLPGSPLSKMSARLSKRRAEDGKGYMGRNIGVFGILELTRDIADRGDEQVRAARHLAKRLHANNSRGDIREMVAAFDGGPVRLAEALWSTKQWRSAISPPRGDCDRE